MTGAVNPGAQSCPRACCHRPRAALQLDVLAPSAHHAAQDCRWVKKRVGNLEFPSTRILPCLVCLKKLWPKKGPYAIF